MHDPDRTIVAVATPPGRGGVGCIRISGAEAPRIAGRLFQPAQAGAASPGQARFGRFIDRDGAALDHGYAVRFDPPHSFTGETVVELWTHGSPAVLGELVSHAMERGAVPAEAGEFTYRAFRSGRIDLTGAEAIRDLVEARTRHQAKVALAQAEGALSRALAPLRESLEEVLARAEAAVEFEDEADTRWSAEALRGALLGVGTRCSELAAQFRAGRLVREGATVVLTGLPNVGKSSLFNRLLTRERAIVAPTPGTTRDTLEEVLDLGGVPATLIDTAGLRNADGEVESEGVRRARAARDRADLVVLVLDAGRPPDAEELAAIGRAQTDPAWLIVRNKCDLPTATFPVDVAAAALDVSARTGAGCGRLADALSERLREAGGAIENPIVTHARHAEALRSAAVALDRAIASATGGFTEEIVLEDVREARTRLGEITGEWTVEALYDRIFSTFCIGK